MALTKYTYSIQNDFPNHCVSLDRLTVEIQTSAITVALDHMGTSGDDCDIWFKDPLLTEKTILDGIVANHSGEPLPDVPTQARSVGSFVPAPDCATPEYQAGDASPMYVDAEGGLYTRGQVLTDETSFRDDFGDATLEDVWTQEVTGSGATVTVANSMVTLTPGLTSGGQAKIHRPADYSPFVAHIYAKVSQRVANQDIFLGFADIPDPATVQNCVAVHLTGTDNTKVLFRSSYEGTAEESEVTLPVGWTTAAFHKYSFDVTTTGVALLVDGELVDRHTLHIPKMYTELLAAACVTNTDTQANATEVDIEYLHFENHNVLQVGSAFQATPIPVRVVEETVTLYGKLTTTSTDNNQEILTYTVPTGRTAYVLGWRISANASGVDANPFKIGKGQLRENQAGEIFRCFFLKDKDQETGEYSSNPRRFAKGGDVLKATVSPNGATSTVWRFSLDLVLR